MKETNKYCSKCGEKLEILYSPDGFAVKVMCPNHGKLYERGQSWERSMDKETGDMWGGNRT